MQEGIKNIEKLILLSCRGCSTATRKVFPLTLLITTFIFLMMCPAVPKISKGYIDQNVILEVGKVSSEKLTKKHSVYNLPDLRAEARTETHFRPRGGLSCLLFAVPQAPPVLSLLSTIRLIL